jgi:hypothetical protein
MHIAIANFYLLSATGPQMPDELRLTSVGQEKFITAKPAVVSWLKRSPDALKITHAGLKPVDLRHTVEVEGRSATVDGVYLRLLVHANEHMGQRIAYSRVNRIAPPWSEGSRK